MSRLPGAGGHLALTIDDGVNSEVVAAFVTLAARTGIRLTFFPNGCYRSWHDNAAALRPLVDSGQVALGNHTWSHPDVTTLDDRALAGEIRRNQQFLWSTFGVRTPFFRPPYGAHDARTDALAADLGHPTIALWDGTLGEDKVLTPAQILAAARQWFRAADRHRPRQPPARGCRVRAAARADRGAEAADGDAGRRVDGIPGPASRRTGRWTCAHALRADTELRPGPSSATLCVTRSFVGGAEDRMNGSRSVSPPGGCGAGVPRFAEGDT